MIIYKATCLVNGKIYIGRTMFTLEKRKKTHLYEAKREVNNMIFLAAIRKYGEENFVWEDISHCSTIDELSALEKYYITFFNSLDPNGYNSIPGGNGPTSGEYYSDKKGWDIIASRNAAIEIKKRLLLTKG